MMKIMILILGFWLPFECVICQHVDSIFALTSWCTGLPNKVITECICIYVYTVPLKIILHICYTECFQIFFCQRHII